MISNSNIPQEWICPITSQLMIDPVIGNDGHTYERKAITEWLSTHQVSPMTRQHMTVASLVPNIALRNTIEQFLESEKNLNNVAPQVPAPQQAQQAQQQSDKVKLIVHSKKIKENDYFVHVRAMLEGDGARKPCAIVCIIDVSGSMGQDATVGGPDAESHGFSRLDLVKHSVRTIINILNAQDYISIVSFSDNGKVVLPMTNMTDANKKLASSKLDSLQPDGSTNIWDGLRVGLELTRDNNKIANHNVAAVLLTDGEPNVHPPKGIVPTFQKYMAQNAITCVTHTFGFGYQLDSPLLTQLSKEGSGTFSYIPDTGFVGTIFCNFLSNLLTTVAPRAQLTISPAVDGVKVTGCLGVSAEDFNKGSISTGPLQYGQSRDFIFQVASNNLNYAQEHILDVKLSFGNKEFNTQVSSLENNQGNEDEFYIQEARLSLVDLTRSLMKLGKSNFAKSQESVKQLISSLKSLPDSALSNDRLKRIFRDLDDSENPNEGQISQAVAKPEWFEKWGRHFLPSIGQAHFIQQCNNFKDPGVQVYGGKLFSEIQDMADTVFCNLPAPTPSNKQRSVYQNNYYGYGNNNNNNRGRSPSPPSSPVNMSSYYDAAGSCFSGNGLVTLVNKSVKRVDELRKGDEVLCTIGNKTTSSARIQCVIKSTAAKPTVKLVKLAKDLLITPWHPVRVQGEWKFPVDLAEAKEYDNVPFVYNLVLEKEHTVTISGVECVTLGHSYKDNEVISHPYFGSNRVIEDLKQMQGWEQGFIQMDRYSLTRDENGFISNIEKL